jgi:hypothetical protein
MFPRCMTMYVAVVKVAMNFLIDILVVTVVTTILAFNPSLKERKVDIAKFRNH